jgi:hypothetical protein
MAEVIVMYVLPNVLMFGSLYLLSKAIERAVEIVMDDITEGNK